MKAIRVPMLWQNALKVLESNGLPLYNVRVLGTSNLYTMFCQKNFFTIFDVILASGFASIHLVKYLIATMANLLPPSEDVHGPTRSMPHLFNGHVGGMSYVSDTGFSLFGAKL